jgi:2-dehydro-3-deoxy-D-arabinonate dehydratase
MKLYRTTKGIFVQEKEEFFILPEAMWDRIICSDRLFVDAQRATAGDSFRADQIGTVLAPIGSQEVWAAGSTYCRKQKTHAEESRAADGGDSYDRVYHAERPQLFFKAAGHRVANPGAAVRIRSDARRSIPEPELTLVINPSGKIVGYTAGNDMSACDIERENPLYLPQAKIYDGSCALGPCVLLATKPLCPETEIAIDIERSGNLEFRGQASLTGLKRKPEQLVEYLFRDTSFADGAYLMTGTPLVPPESFTLAHGDRIRITIEGVGTLENYVA